MSEVCLGIGLALYGVDDEGDDDDDTQVMHWCIGATLLKYIH